MSMLRLGRPACKMRNGKVRVPKNRTAVDSVLVAVFRTGL